MRFIYGFSNFLYTLVWVAPEYLHLAYIEINLFFMELLTYWQRWFTVLYTNYVVSSDALDTLSTSQYFSDFLVHALGTLNMVIW